jgi:hypothetical protein
MVTNLTTSRPGKCAFAHASRDPYSLALRLAEGLCHTAENEMTRRMGPTRFLAKCQHLARKRLNLRSLYSLAETT